MNKESVLKVLCAIISQEGAPHPDATYEKKDSYKSVVEKDIQRAIDYVETLEKLVE